MNRERDMDAEPTTGESGQTLVEYAAVLSVITIAILLTVQGIGNSAGALFQKVVAILT